MALNTKELILRSIVDDVLPAHVVANYPELVNAVKHYADFLQNINKSGYYLNSIDLQRDIDRVEEEFLNQLQKEIGVTIPRQFATDPRKFYKRISDFYQSRGTSDSIKSFFKLLFDDNVELYYPKDDMLIPSDGKYFDQTQDIIQNPDSYTPGFLYTVPAPTYILQSNITDVYDRKLTFENPIIFVNNQLIENYTTFVVPNLDTGVLDYSIEFEEELPTGSIIKIFRSGAFTTNDGFLDDSKYIQDSFFYQKFSYVIRTGTNSEEWKNAFNRLVHPAGFIFFGQILLLMEQLVAAPFIQPGLQRGGLPFPIIINPVESNITFVKTRNSKFASYIVKEYKFNHQSNKFAANAYFDRFKFTFDRLTIGEISNYTIEDVINNKVNINLDSIIVTESN